MYENPYDRKFGIEFEFGLGTNYNNIRHLEGYDKYDKVNKYLEVNGLKGFRTGYDGSEFEVKTPILSGPNGFKKVKKFLELINDIGAYVSLRADGLHVHHDAPEFLNNRNAVLRLVENWIINQDQIMDMVDQCRRNRYACPSWDDSGLAYLKNSDDVTRGTGRRNLNISSLSRHRTIEIRLHEGTLNYEEVLSWVRFGQAFIHKALEETESFIQSEDSFDLMKKVNVSRNASRFLSRKLSGEYQAVNRL